MKNFGHIILQHIIWFFIKTLYSTYKIRITNLDLRNEAVKQSPGGGVVFALFHEHVFHGMCGHAWNNPPYLGTASRSKDGDYAAFVGTKMGLHVVRGSSRKRGIDKGGKEVIQEYVDKISNGYFGGLTIDGPKGPRHVCKPGVVLIAQATGAPILPIAATASSYWEFKSWDKFKIPKPFSTITLTYAEAIFVPKEVEGEAIDGYTKKVSGSLLDLLKKMDPHYS